jgi:hypothetical protein
VANRGAAATSLRSVFEITTKPKTTRVQTESLPGAPLLPVNSFFQEILK